MNRYAAASAVLGAAYLVMAAMALAGWSLGLGSGQEAPWGWLVRGDPGLSLVYATTAALLIGGVYYRDEGPKSLACLLVGAALGVAAFAVETLTSLALAADAYLAGEVVTAVPPALEVVLGAASAPLLAVALRSARGLTRARRMEV